MKLSLQLGYWGAQPPANAGDLVQAAEECGFDTVYTAEAWGSDAFTPLAWWGRTTSRIKLGTALAQLSARTPTATAMHALTLDHLSGGRMVLGLGVSGPQVVEGWYGQPFPKPLARTREFVNIARQVFAREDRVTNDGPHYPLPLTGEGTAGLGKPLKPIVHPLRADVPILIGAEGPKNIALSAEIADGWMPIFYSPSFSDMYDEWLDEGFSRPTARRTRDEFEIAATVTVAVTSSDQERRDVLDFIRPVLALYIGGMGAKAENFHKRVFDRMGYAEQADKIQQLYLEGKKDEATALVPDELIDDIAIVGDEARVRDEVARWSEAGVTQLVTSFHDVDQIRATAEVIVG